MPSQDSRASAAPEPAAISFFPWPHLALTSLAWQASLRQAQAVHEVQNRMARRTTLLCQRAASELAHAANLPAAWSIQQTAVLAYLLDIGKLWSELSLATAPALPEPVKSALAESTPPGATPEQVQVQAWPVAAAAAGASRALALSAPPAWAAAALPATPSERPRASDGKPRRRPVRKTDARSRKSRSA